MNKFTRIADFSMQNDSYKYVTLYQVRTVTETQTEITYSVRVSDDDGITDHEFPTQEGAIAFFQHHVRTYIERKLL